MENSPNNNNNNNNNNNPSTSLSSFLCNEDTSCLSEENDKFTDPSNYNIPSFHFNHNYNHDYNNDNDNDDDDYIKLMIRKETGSGSGPGSLSSYPSWLHRARSDSLNWILHAKMKLGFCNQTAYLSIMYFDRFLSMRCLNEDRLWAIRLLSIACLTLAAKMEESKVPPLSEYPLEGGYGFESRMIRKMELLVLSSMDWKMCLVTPFVYLNFLVRKLGYQQGGNDLDGLISRAIDLIVTSTQEINTMENQPSIVAGAAVIAAISPQLTHQDFNHKFSTLSLWPTSLNEELYRCYTLMKRLVDNNDANTPISTQVIVSQELRATTSVTKTKRRLDFSDGDPTTTPSGKTQRR